MKDGKGNKAHRKKSTFYSSILILTTKAIHAKSYSHFEPHPFASPEKNRIFDPSLKWSYTQKGKSRFKTPPLLFLTWHIIFVGGAGT